MSTTLADAVGKLEAMGSPDQIALELEGMGIRADRYESLSCAVSKYVNIVAPDLDHVSTARRVAFSGFIDTVHLPTSVTAFIDNFDAGLYPNLVASDA